MSRTVIRPQPEPAAGERVESESAPQSRTPMSRALADRGHAGALADQPGGGRGPLALRDPAQSALTAAGADGSVSGWGGHGGGDEEERKVEVRVLVTGATGLQGGAVTRRCLGLGFTVVGLTRTPDSPQSIELSRLGVLMVKGDMDDPLALDRALAVASGAAHGNHPTPGALYGVFGVQNYWLPTPSVEREVQQGRNLIDAAKRAGVRHFVYSSIGGCTQEAGPFRRRGGTGIPQFESKRRIEEHLKEAGLRYTILRPAFLIDNFWHPVSPWAHPETHVVMPAHPNSVQQMVWSDDIGALCAKAFQQADPDDRTDPWLERELEVAGDQLTGPQIAAVFSIVTGRHMMYKRGPPTTLLRCFSREAYMQTKFIDHVGFSANVGECRKLLPSMHTLEGALRANGFEGKPSQDFQQSVCCDCHTPDMFLCSMVFPCCVTGWVARGIGKSCVGWTLASAVAYPCALTVLRGHVREHFGMKGSCPLDCFTTFCCPLTTTVQQAAEVRFRKTKLVDDMDRDWEV